MIRSLIELVSGPSFADRARRPFSAMGYIKSSWNGPAGIGPAGIGPAAKSFEQNRMRWHGIKMGAEIRQSIVLAFKQMQVKPIRVEWAEMFAA